MSIPIELAQFIAYVTLTVTGLTVAIVSLRFSYRQNFGWKPILLRTSLGLKGLGRQKEYSAFMQFEFWNRQTYPVVVRSIHFNFENLDFIRDYSPKTNKPKWHLHHDGKVTYRADAAISGKEHHTFDFEAPFKTPSLDELNAPVTITAHYFDPRLNKHRELTIKDVYTLNN